MIERKKGVYILLLAAGAYSTLSLFTGILTKEHLSVFSILAGRYVVIIAITFIVSTFILRKAILIGKKEVLFTFFNSLFFLGGSVTYTLGIAYGTSLTKAVALNYAYPIIVIFVEYLLFKVLPTKRKVLAVFLSLISVAFVLEIWKVHNLFQLGVGDGLELINAIFYGTTIVFAKKLDETDTDSFKVLFYTFLFALPELIILTILLSVFGIHALPLSFTFHTSNILPFLGIGLLGSVIPLSLIYYGEEFIMPSLASGLLLTGIIWVMIWQLLLFHTQIDVLQSLGIAGIMISVLLIH